MNPKAYALAIALCAMAAAHADDPTGMVEAPCPTPPEPTLALRELLVEVFIEPGEVTPADLARLEQDADLATLNEARRQLAAGDWAALCRYDAANDLVRAGRPAGGLRPDLGNDGVHPNRRGYDVMRRLVEPTLGDP